MFYFLSLMMGLLISVMVAVNGGLTGFYGVYSATVMIHVVGLVLIGGAVAVKRDRVLGAGVAWYFYLGGAIGVLTTVFNNVSFGRISVSAILALGLLGQSVAGLVIDQYGLLGMQKHPFARHKLLGLALILAGIASMITGFEIVAVVISFFAGVNIVLSRTLNAQLAAASHERVSTFYNYVIGLAVSLAAFALLGRGEIDAFTLSPQWWIYLGGAFGVTVVLLGNIVAVKVSAFYLTLLIFVGQVFTGVVVDVVLTQSFSARNIVGGALVAAGLAANLLLDKKIASPKK